MPTHPRPAGATRTPDENFLYVFKGARYAAASGRPPRHAGRAACLFRSLRAGVGGRSAIRDTTKRLKQTPVRRVH